MAGALERHPSQPNLNGDRTMIGFPKSVDVGSDSEKSFLNAKSGNFRDDSRQKSQHRKDRNEK